MRGGGILHVEAGAGGGGSTVTPRGNAPTHSRFPILLSARPFLRPAVALLPLATDKIQKELLCRAVSRISGGGHDLNSLVAQILEDPASP